MEKVTGIVTGVNGNLITAEFDGSVKKNEVCYVLVGDERLKGEVIRITNGVASMQVYEMTNGVQVGDRVELSGELLSVELGPGLLTQVYDGLQNPLPELADQCGFFLKRGVYLDPIPDKSWEFTPVAKVGDSVQAGDTLGTVPEGLFTHHIMVPFGLKDEGWTVKSIQPKGTYHVRSTVAVLENRLGETKELSMVFSWPIKEMVHCYAERLRLRPWSRRSAASTPSCPWSRAAPSACPAPSAPARRSSSTWRPRTPPWTWSLWPPAASAPAKSSRSSRSSPS